MDSKWTPEVIASEIDAACKQTEQYASFIVTFVENNRSDIDNKEFRDTVLALSRMYFALKGAPLTARIKARREISDKMLDGKFLPAYVKLFSRNIDRGLKCRFLDENGKIDRTLFNPLNNTLKIAFNFSDASPKFATVVCQYDEFLGALIRIQSELRHDCFQKTLADDVVDFLRVAISCPYNFMIHNVDENTRRIQESGMVQSVKPYLQFHENERILVTALFFVAYAVSEKEAELFRTQKNAIDFLIKYLSIAINDKYKRGRGYSSVELAKGLERLAKNDTNKRQLVEQGILPVLKLMITSDALDERELAYLILWTLAFDTANREQISKEVGETVRMVSTDIEYKMKEDDTEEDVAAMKKRIEKARQGVLWVLEDRGSAEVKKKKKKAKPETMFDTTEEQSQHVMISYAWSNKEIVRKIREELKQQPNMKIWIDYEQMQGSTLDAMAVAVENSSLVFICYSKSYKDSQNCRSEAEYAYRLGKPFIPVLVEPKYHADGWLGIMLGTKLYYDFSGKYPFREKYEEMMQAVGGTSSVSQNVNKKSEEIVPVISTLDQHTPSEVDHKTPTPKDVTDLSSTAYLANWNPDDVFRWCREIGLVRPQVSSLTGRNLRFLKKLHQDAPEFFYRLIETKLQLSSIDEIMLFVEGLNAL